MVPVIILVVIQAYERTKTLFRCNVPMQEREGAGISDGVSWYCPQCYTCKSIRDGNFFSNLSKITLQKWMILLHLWVHQYPVTEAMQEAEVDRRTAYQWLWEICSSSLMRGQIVLGGQWLFTLIKVCFVTNQRYVHSLRSDTLYPFFFYESLTKN